MAEKLSTESVINTTWSPDGSVAVMKGLGIAMNFSDSLRTIGHTPHQSIGTTEDTRGVDNSKIAHYGTSNQYPNNIYKVINSNSKLKVGIQHAQIELLGGGVETVVDTDQGYERRVFPAWKKLYDKANFLKNYEILAARSLKTYYMIFASVVFTKDGQKVAAIKALSPKYCRLAKPNINGYSQYCYVSADWEHNTGLDGVPTNHKRLEVIDNFIDSAMLLKERMRKTTNREFCYVVKVPTDELIYPRPDWVSVIEQGWVDVSNDVPKFKRWVMENMTTLNQIMYISESYFEAVYPDWKQLKMICQKDMKQQVDGKPAYQILEERRKDLVQKVEQKLAGLDKSAKMITAPMIIERLGDKVDLVKSITFEKIDQHNFSNAYNADANEADTQIFASLRLDPSRFGNLTRTDSQGGTGKREAFNIGQSSETMFEELFLELYYFIRDYNGLPQEMEFQVKRANMPTLDKVTPIERQTNIA